MYSAIEGCEAARLRGGGPGATQPGGVERHALRPFHRPARRPEGVHPQARVGCCCCCQRALPPCLHPPRTHASLLQSGPHGARRDGSGPRPPLPPARGAGLPQVPARRQGDHGRVRVPREEGRQRAGAPEAGRAEGAPLAAHPRCCPRHCLCCCCRRSWRSSASRTTTCTGPRATRTAPTLSRTRRTRSRWGGGSRGRGSGSEPHHPHPLPSQHIFNVAALDLAAVGRSFGFAVPPRVNLNISATGEKVTKRGGGGGFGDPAKRRMSDYADPAKRRAALLKIQASSGHSFSASNPYGKRPAGDTRQFTR